MVEYSLNINNIFHSLADPTRRDILRRVCETEHTISELAQKYDISFAAVAKHLNVLEKAHLITKRKSGKQQIVSVETSTIEFASEHLKQYEKIWADRFNRLDEILKDEI